MDELKEDIREAKKEKAAALLAGHVSLAEKVQEGLNIMLRRLEEKEKQGESQPKSFVAMHGEIVTSSQILDLSRDNQTSPMHTHLDHSPLCRIISLPSLSSSLSRCLCLDAVLLSTRQSNHDVASDSHTLSHDNLAGGTGGGESQVPGQQPGEHPKKSVAQSTQSFH